MVKLVDTTSLNLVAVKRLGSSPGGGTIIQRRGSHMIDWYSFIGGFGTALALLVFLFAGLSILGIGDDL